MYMYMYIYIYIHITPNPDLFRGPGSFVDKQFLANDDRKAMISVCKRSESHGSSDELISVFTSAPFFKIDLNRSAY